MGFNVDTVKKILRRETFNFDRRDINLYIFFPQLRMLLAMNGIFFNKRDSLLRFMWPFIGTTVSIAGWLLEVRNIWHYLSIKDYNLAIECFCYWLLMGAIPLVTISVNLNNNNIYNLIESMNKDFVLICSLGFKYRQPFLKRQLQIWQLYTVWFVFAVTVGLSYSLLPMMVLSYQTLSVTQDENTVRPLPVPMWLPNDDPYRTPTYEILLFVESFISIYFVQSVSVYVYIMFHILIHYYCVLEMMIIDVEAIFDGLDETVVKLPRSHVRRVETQLILNKRIGRIVNMHISVFTGVRTASSIYGAVLVYQILFSSLGVCFIGFRIMTKLEEGMIDYLFFMLGTAVVSGIWIPCYLGTLVRNKAFAFGDACWECGWQCTSLSLLVCPDLTIIIQQTQQPITIEFTGLPNIELETFSAEMSKAYSYFNMLRQYSS